MVVVEVFLLIPFTGNPAEASSAPPSQEGREQAPAAAVAAAIAVGRDCCCGVTVFSWFR